MLDYDEATGELYYLSDEEIRMRDLLKSEPKKVRYKKLEKIHVQGKLKPGSLKENDGEELSFADGRELVTLSQRIKQLNNGMYMPLAFDNVWDRQEY